MSYFAKMTQKVLTVNTSEVALPPPALGDEVQNPEAIFIQADDENTSPVVLGKAGVLANKTTGGFKFSPGDNGILPFTREETLKAISLQAGQVIYVTYLAEANPRH